MDIKNLEKRVVVSSRFLSIVAVLGTLAGSMLMFVLGAINIYAAFRFGFTDEHGDDVFGTRAVINVIEGLDRFLIAIVLLYFSYGVYSLFIHPEEGEEELSLPGWLRVTQIGQLKQVVAELIVIILFVLFLRQALETFSAPNDSLTMNALVSLMVLPVSTLLLALALRLLELHPKTGQQSASKMPSDSDKR
ncbi:YqhA family protein [Pseudorhodoplanes sp.]|uniref:YqhA family protein n=1 Tax=Pseudorhodoplanes sp. TaxID=1934341 RepID=UPI003D134C6C